MLRCFHLHGSFTNADFVEVGCEPQDIDETPDNRTHTILPLSDAVAQMFNSDSPGPGAPPRWASQACI